MTKKWFVIGDIHGRMDMLEKILKEKKEEEQVVFLGDYIDRGPDSLAVLRTAMALRAEGAICIKGNHEDMFLHWLDDPVGTASLYLPQGGYQTLQSFLPGQNVFQMDVTYLADLIEATYKEEIRFMRSLELYHETERYVFLHAGVNLQLPDWRDSRTTDFYWMREPFFYTPNHSGKVFVFGHTPTKNLNRDGSFDVWVSTDQTRIGIDGGAVFGGKLHGLHIAGSVWCVTSVGNDSNVLAGTVG